MFCLLLSAIARGDNSIDSVTHRLALEDDAASDSPHWTRKKIDQACADQALRKVACDELLARMETDPTNPLENSVSETKRTSALREADEYRVIFSPESSNLGFVPVGQSRQFDVVITNDSVSPVTFASIYPTLIKFGPAERDSFTEVSSTCGTGLGAGEDCTVRIDFTPTASGTYSPSLNVSVDQSTELFRHPITAESSDGETYTITFSPDRTDFGHVIIGNSEQADILITNQSTAPVTFASIYPTLIKFGEAESDSFTEVSNTCGAGLGIDESCTVRIDFTPTGAGTFSPSLNVAVEQSTELFRHSITAESSDGETYAITFSPDRTDFGQVIIGDSVQSDILVRNQSTAPITFASIYPTLIKSGEAERDSFTEVSSTCGTGLGIEETCSVRVDFTPTATGSYSPSLNVGINESTDLFRSSITGSGINPPPDIFRDSFEPAP